ncbi:FAD-dependent monooxygenase [Streptomyces sp. WG5]|uniref:FAD-dependent monooxygenase n=1 Tax=Streptomyces sp. WG5 TaxID=3417648 RepID=UPI003CFBBD5B
MDVVVLGAGPVGLMAAMMPPRDGHRVTVLERDGAPAPDANGEELWRGWHRPGVNQFRHPHMLLPAVLRTPAEELPDVAIELTARGRRSPVSSTVRSGSARSPGGNRATNASP